MPLGNQVTYRVEDQGLSEKMHGFVIRLARKRVERTDRAGFEWFTQHMSSGRRAGMFKIFLVWSAEQIGDQFQLRK